MFIQVKNVTTALKSLLILSSFTNLLTVCCIDTDTAYFAPSKCISNKNKHQNVELNSLLSVHQTLVKQDKTLVFFNNFTSMYSKSYASHKL